MARSPEVVKREVLFAGRWGDRGLELFVVGKCVRRVPIPAEHDRTLAIAGEMLAKVMRCRPAARLARRFAEAQLAPVPADGFVLSTAEIEAWLDTGQ
jgi:hypothetical protein